MKLEDNSAVVSADIETKGYEILCSYPLRAFTLHGSTGLQSSSTYVAVLGLLGKMTGAAAVVGVTEMRIEENGRLRIRTTLKALGVLGIYVSTLRQRTIERDIMVTIQGRPVPLETVTASEESPVLQIDTEKAWGEMGLEPGWGNEIVVEVFVR